MKSADEMHPEKDEMKKSGRLSRRHFLSTLGAATAISAITGCGKKKDGGSGILDIDPTELEPGQSRVSTAHVTSYDENELKTAMEYIFDKLEGLSDIIKSGDTVGIKVNMTGGDGSASSYQQQTRMPVGETYWTNPTLLKVLGELIKDAGAAKLYVVEAIYDWASVNNYGYKEVIEYLGAEMIDLNQKAPYASYKERSVGPNHLIYSTLTQNGILDDFDCFISLAKSKRHAGGGVTHGMKNLVGTLPVPSGKYNAGQGHRAAIHQHRSIDGNPDSNLRRVIVDLNNATPIQLVVNDAIKTVTGGEGPWLSTPLLPVSYNKLIVSKDPVAADAIATQVIGYDPTLEDAAPFEDGINYLKLANELGMGNYDPANIQVVGAGV